MDTTYQDSKEETGQVLAGMLTENTGTHFLDSGGKNGRAWQRNQGRAFENEPETTLNASWGYLDVTHNVYHWLKERLMYNEDLDKRFQEFATSDGMERESWFACGDAFMKLLEAEAEENGTPLGGIYGEGEPLTVNTYNHESLLSQTIQYTYWEDEDGAHVMLQIHGGADVRGGYTRPVFFDCDDNVGELAFLDDGRASIYCMGEHAVKDQEADVDLKDCEIVKYDTELEDGSEPKPGNGYIFVDENGVPHCPTCGSPLSASPY